MTTTLSEAVRALEFKTPRAFNGAQQQVYREGIQNALAAAAALVKQHEAQEPVAWDGHAWRLRDDLRDLITGMSVSIDVSTCDEDADHRYYGKVNIVQDAEVDKCGVVLLVQEVEQNFDTQPTLAATQAGDAWISVQDRLPEPHCDVLAASNWGIGIASRHDPKWANGCFQDHATQNDEGMIDWDDGKGAFKVTHWMPLPSAPTTTRSE